MPDAPRWYTPRTARRVLRRIRPTVELLHRLWVELDYRRPDPIGSDLAVDPLYFVMARRLAHGLAALEARGLLVDELRDGRLDFPAWLDDRPVVLCWRVGEPELRFWHVRGNGRPRVPFRDGDRFRPPGAPRRRPYSLC
ncbi:MAG TPA: DUF2203 family protein [Candidatus Polarisedimenticolaceae bacterium]|nr:DUF2203 family protein [Candidatus Polarisedimenticolaceae bacterium]